MGISSPAESYGWSDETNQPNIPFPQRAQHAPPLPAHTTWPLPFVGTANRWNRLQNADGSLQRSPNRRVFPRSPQQHKHQPNLRPLPSLKTRYAIPLCQLLTPGRDSPTDYIPTRSLARSSTALFPPRGCPAITRRKRVRSFRPPSPRCGDTHPTADPETQAHRRLGVATAMGGGCVRRTRSACARTRVPRAISLSHRPMGDSDRSEPEHKAWSADGLLSR